MKSIALMSLCLLALLVRPCRAEWGILPDGRLDMNSLRRTYTEGEFEPVRKTLENYMKKHGKDATRDEKVFAHIYLGVIYAADSAAAVRAENHFNALLDLAPNVELVDMFIPPKIQFLFDRVKHDFLRAQEYGKKYDALGNPLPNQEPTQAGNGPSRNNEQPPRQASLKEHKPGKTWAFWTLGAVAVVGAGVGAYYLTAADEDPGSNRTANGL